MDFREALREKVLVFDGAMGTSIQAAAPDDDAFGGHEGLNEWLNLTRPDVIRDIHAAFLHAGCDVIETNSFGAFPVVLDEYGVGGRAEELAVAAARIAREAADEAAAPGKPRYVAGSMGPGTRLPSLGHIRYADLREAYMPMARGLIAGGCDLLLVETCQDLLQLRAAVAACRAAAREAGRDLPLGVQITVEASGTMLLGTETSAAVAAVLPLRPDFIGMNCATGPEAMRGHLRTICRRSPVPVSALPNAGLPRNIDGRMVYDLGPEEFAADLLRFIEDFGVGIVGGCCGTTPEHLRALAAAVGERPAPRRDASPPDALSSLYQATPLDQEPRPLLIGERTNANGSNKFRSLQAADDIDAMVAMARDQQQEGAHVLDVCVAYVGRDEVADMDGFARRLNTEIQLPVMIDSTDPAAIRAALEGLGGRCIVNSINLEDGEGRAREVLELCREFGAAVVALCIDEKGMARTPERKLEVARRLADLAAEYGLGPGDILFDPLTFTLASGDREYDRSALDTLAGLRLIKEAIPGARTLLGLSNVSFGLKPRIRRVLNSVFLQRALDSGLDAAILHAGRILGPADVPEDLSRACERLIDGDRAGEDPLAVLLEADLQTGAEAEAAADLPVAERLRLRIVQGRSDGLSDDIEAALAEGREPLAIINDILLDGMREVGELFGSGRLQLPFVLKSAETMKAAVKLLEPRMERSEAASRGRFLIATVRGDVHDIGKNLVDIILTNNGFTVENMGIKVPVEQLIEAIRRDAPDAVGLSGLLVKSTVVMKENLEAFNEAGIDLPVVLGGAALTRKYVEGDLRRIYRGPVYYARDAFDGLKLVGAISGGEPPAAEPRDHDAADGDPGEAEAPPAVPLRPADPVPEPPFWGSRIETGIDLEEVWELLNRPALVKGRWGYTRAGMPKEEYRRLERMEIDPALARLKRSALDDGWLRPAAVRGWFSAAADGDRLLVYADPGDAEPAWTFTFPRQRKSPRRCLSDYFGGRGPGGRDVLGVMAVTVGAAATEKARALMDDDDYREYLLLHGFAVETAEALAEHVHRLMRRELGIDRDDAPTAAGVIRCGYRGRRYSFGYPACPELADQRILAGMLDWQRIGLSLSGECQLHPEQSVSAVVAHHPEAQYYSV